MKKFTFLREGGREAPYHKFLSHFQHRLRGVSSPSTKWVYGCSVIRKLLLTCRDMKLSRMKHFALAISFSSSCLGKYKDVFLSQYLFERTNTGKTTGVAKTVHFRFVPPFLSFVPLFWDAFCSFVTQRNQLLILDKLTKI